MIKTLNIIHIKEIIWFLISYRKIAKKDKNKSKAYFILIKLFSYWIIRLSLKRERKQMYSFDEFDILFDTSCALFYWMLSPFIYMPGRPRLI